MQIMYLNKSSRVFYLLIVDKLSDIDMGISSTQRNISLCESNLHSTETTHQISISEAKFVIGHLSSLAVAVTANSAKFPSNNVLIIADSIKGHDGIDCFIAQGKSIPSVQRIVFAPGKGSKWLALLYSSFWARPDSQRVL
jgi:hypothetical protein